MNEISILNKYLENNNACYCLPEDKSSFGNSELKNASFNFRKDNTCNSITQIEKGLGYHSKEILSIIWPNIFS